MRIPAPELGSRNRLASVLLVLGALLVRCCRARGEPPPARRRSPAGAGHHQHGGFRHRAAAGPRAADRGELPALRERRLLLRHPHPSRRRQFRHPGRRPLGHRLQAQAGARPGLQRVRQRPAEQARHGGPGARRERPTRAMRRFYVNLVDNPDLDPLPTRWGYAVFGRVVQGMDVVDRIGVTPTGCFGPFKSDTPLKPVDHQEGRSDRWRPARPRRGPAPMPTPSRRPGHHSLAEIEPVARNEPAVRLGCAPGCRRAGGGRAVPRISCDTHAADAEALYILGDLFEIWVGDDDPDPTKARVCEALRELTASGVGLLRPARQPGLSARARILPTKPAAVCCRIRSWRNSMASGCC